MKATAQDLKRYLGVKLMKKALVVFSGGMDSTVALYDAIEKYEDVETITFNYGSKHNDAEYAYALKTCGKLGVKNTRIDLDFINQYFQSDLLKSGGDIPEGHYEEETMKATVVPFRNGIMLSIAAGLAESGEAQTLVLGNHYGDHAIYPDCRQIFADALGVAIQLCDWKEVKLIRPFVNITKGDIAKIGKDLKVDFTKTWSCYKGLEKQCGKCGTCIERREALYLGGVEDLDINYLPDAPSLAMLITHNFKLKEIEAKAKQNYAGAFVH